MPSLESSQRSPFRRVQRRSINLEQMRQSAKVEETLRSIMLEVEREMFFYTGGSALYGREQLPEWAQSGGNCVDFSNAVVVEMQKPEIETNTSNFTIEQITDTLCEHYVALLTHQNGRRVIADPSHLAQGLLVVGRPDECDAYPEINKQKSKMVIHTANDVSRVVWKKVQERRDFEYCINWKHCKRLLTNGSPEIARILAKKPSVIRKLLKDGSYIMLAGSPENPNGDLVIKGTGENLFMQGEAMFDRMLDILAEEVIGERRPDEIYVGATLRSCSFFCIPKERQCKKL